MRKILCTLMFSAALLAAMPGAFAEEKVDPTEAQERQYERRQADMNVLDLNKDGTLQASELQQAVKTKFKNADINKDGVVSQAEREANIGAFAKKAPKEYGTQTERNARRLEYRYDDADVNKDGRVSEEEYVIFFGNRYKNYDRNGDGIVDKTEYRTDVEKLPQSYFREDNLNPQPPEQQKKREATK